MSKIHVIYKEDVCLCYFYMSIYENILYDIYTVFPVCILIQIGTPYFNVADVKLHNFDFQEYIICVCTLYNRLAMDCAPPHRCLSQ